jgi:diguanylate cyclase (GGDEF)-like protein
MNYSNLNYLSHSKKTKASYLDFKAINDSELLMLSSLLHQSLNIDNILTFFLEYINTIRSVVKIQYVTEYYNLNITKSLTNNLKYEASKNYKIFNLNDNNLGFIKVYTFCQVDTYFNHLISNTIPYLSAALRNSMQYKLAIDSSKKDFLTKLDNRQSFDESVDKLIAQSLRNKKEFTCMIIDIDFFKKINDSYGHDAGDHILISISKILSRHVRKSDMVFRYGGEEFCVLLPNTGRTGALSIAEKLRSILESTSIRYKNININITASFGVSLFNKSDDKFSLTKKADLALYCSKSEGRNKVNYK